MKKRLTKYLLKHLFLLSDDNIRLLEIVGDNNNIRSFNKLIRDIVGLYLSEQIRLGRVK